MIKFNMSNTTSKGLPKANDKHKSRTSNAPFPSSGFTFLALPAEIRNKIYHLVLPRRGVCRPNASVLMRRSRYGFRAPKPGPFALARTCKQIEAELSSIYFGERSFHFDTVYDMYHFLDNIGPGRRSFIASIRVRLQKEGKFQTKHRDRRSPMPMQEMFKASFNLLGECKSLKTLYLQVNIGTIQALPNGRSKNGRSLLALRSEGLFAAVHGLENLDLRVRESFHPSISAPDLFLLDATPGSAFTAEHLQLFEKLLRGDMTSSGNTALPSESKNGSRTRKPNSDLGEVTLRMRGGVKRMISRLGEAPG